MPLTGVDIYKKLLPKTNCGDCGISSCFTFAALIASNQEPLEKCPHIDPELLTEVQAQLDQDRTQGTTVKKDPAQDALEWARKRSASMKLEDLPERIGGRLEEVDGAAVLALPYFNDTVLISQAGIRRQDTTALNHWEQVFIYNHMAQGGRCLPVGRWITMQDIPNSLPKIQTMQSYVEAPLARAFKGRADELLKNATALGAISHQENESGADLAILFKPLPRIPVLLLFWDEDVEEGFAAQARLLFDETIGEHLDVESITFLCEHLKALLCGE